MKRVFVGMGLLLAATAVLAQSPPETATGTIGGKTIIIKYCSPRVNGREGQIFTKDGLVAKTHQSYPVWRAGANSATTLQTDANLTIGDLNVPAGTYTLFVDISNPDQWILVVSKKIGEWGLAYDNTADLGRTKMMMSKPPSMVEDLKYTLTDNGGNKGSMTLAWEDHSASAPITVH